MALGHFHERVGESPRREKNFGTSGSKKKISFPRYGRLKLEIGVRADFTTQNLGSVNGP